MIYHCYFGGFPVDGLNVAKFGRAPVVVDPWEALRVKLENSKDTFVWIVTRKQLRDFLSQINKHDLRKFCVVAHDQVVPMDERGRALKPEEETMGCANHNYAGDPHKLKVFVMKGVQ